MRYLRRFNESIKHEDFENLILDIKDLNYELGDMDIKMIIKPDPEQDPIGFNMLRHYLSGSLPDTGRVHSDFNVTFIGDFNKLTTDQGDNLVRIINHLKSILDGFGLFGEVMIGSEVIRLNGWLVTQLNVSKITIKITKK